MKLEALDEDCLCQIQFRPCPIGIEPLDAVDLRIGAITHHEVPGNQCGRVEVGFECPGDDDLAGLELGFPQRSPYALGHGPTGFLEEFPAGGFLIRFAFLDQALDQGPPPVVTTTEERSPRMSEHHLDPVPNPERKKTGRPKTAHYPEPVNIITATTPTSNQVVVTPLPDFRLGDLEALPAGLKRLTLNEMEVAASGFFAGEEAFSDAVHEARKSTKRIRSVLRLIKGELGERIFNFEDRWMRDTARLVSPVRDTAARVESMNVLDRIYGHMLADGVLEETLYRLDTQRRRVETRVMEDPEIVLSVVENLEKAHGRYSNWPVDDSARSIYGVGIRDEFAAIGPGLAETYGSGRSQMVGAYKHIDPARFHEWRKSVKYLRHQMELLTPLWPEVVVGMAITLDRVGELLGQDHDLAMLIQQLETDINLCPDPVERSLIAALANQRRADLQTAARILGRRVFAEEPESLTGRFDAYWEGREPENLAALARVMM